MTIANTSPIDYIAIWGAVTGSVALIIQLLQFARDRSRLKLDASFLICSDIQRPEMRLKFELNIVNIGRRPIVIESAGVINPALNQ